MAAPTRLRLLHYRLNQRQWLPVITIVRPLLLFAVAARPATTSHRIALDIDAFVHRNCQGGQPRAETGGEPLLSALRKPWPRRTEADSRIQELLAYARAFASPHPYTLFELAQVTAMSMSRVRTVYDADDIAAATAATGLSLIPGTRR